MGLYCRFAIMFMHKGKLDDKKNDFFFKNPTQKITPTTFYPSAKSTLKIVMGVQ